MTDLVQSSGSGSAGGTLVGSRFMRCCCHCGEEAPANECCQYGNQYCCHVCKTNYNRNNERCRKDARVKLWWKNLAKAEKQAWFKRNKATYEPMRRSAFDDSGQYAESQAKSDVKSDYGRMQFLTLDDWIIRQKLLGNVTGTLDEQKAQALASFQDLVMDKNVHTPWDDGEYLVPVKRGREVKVGEEDRHSQEWKRQKTISDSVENAAARDLAEKHQARMQTWMASQHAALCAHAAPQSNELEDLPPGLARNPLLPRVCDDDMQDEVNREILLAQQRDQKVMEQEERDDHEANMAQRLRKQQVAALGRPPKNRTVLLSSCSKLVRDKGQKIEDYMGDFNKQLEELGTEIVSVFHGSMPVDLKSVFDSAKADLKVIADKIAKEKDSIHHTFIHSFIHSFSICLFVCLLACLFVCLLACLFVFVCVCLFVCVFVCLFVCLCVCLFVCRLVRFVICSCVCFAIAALFCFEVLGVPNTYNQMTGKVGEVGYGRDGGRVQFQQRGHEESDH